MDFLTGLACLLITAVLGFIIYFILVSSMKEKTYDEVKAEQKKKAEEYFAQGRSAKEKAKDKKLKKAGKKVKEKASSESIEVSSDEVDTSKGHVVFVETPTVVDEQSSVIEERKRKKNKKKEKPILLNKNEITSVVDVPSPLINHFEQIVPKDDFTLKRSTSRDDDIEKPTEPQPVVHRQPGNKQSKTQSNPSKEAKIEKSQPQKPVEQVPKTVVTEKPVTSSKQVEKPVVTSSKQVEKPVVTSSKQAEKPVTSSKQAEKPVTSSKQAEKPSVKPQEKPQVQQKPLEEVVSKVSSKQVQNAAPPTASESSPSIKSSRKKRNELATLQQMSGEKEAVNVSLLMPLVHKAELSRTEIQVLIDLLLNKQQGSSVDSAEWIEGRQDPIVKLKKQLAEKEKALADEQEAGTALQSKLRELRTELNTERHSARQLEEGLTATRASLQHSAEEKQGLLQQIQQLQGKLSEEHRLLCKLQEDQGQAMQQELLAQRQQLELHIARLTDQHQETITALEAQLGQLAVQLQEQEAVTSGLNGELTVLRERAAHVQDSQDLARQVKELHTEIERLISKSQYDTSRLQSELSTVTEQLSVKRAESEKLSSLVQSLQADNSRLTHQISSACSEAQQLRDENESLAAQVTASMERPATEGRENGDVAYNETKHVDTNSDKTHEKDVLLEKLKHDIVTKDKEISLYKTELAQKETSLTSLKGELDVAHVKAEKMLKEISLYRCMFEEQESAKNALREECGSAHKLVNTLREDIGKNKAEIVRLGKECATREQLESRENTIEKLTSELNTHKTKLADQAALIQNLQKELEKHKTNVEDSVRQEKLISELNLCKTELAEKEAKMKTLTAQSDKYVADMKQLKGELSSSKEAVIKLTQDLKEFAEKHTSLTLDLETQKHKNDDLRSKNWKAMDALATTEKTLETKLKQSQRLVSEAEECARKQEQERTKQLLQRILPQVSVDSKEDYEGWLEQFARSTGESGGGGEMLSELERQNSQLQAMVTHYKAIIADTEGMLNQLQSHVEQEEGRWGQQIESLQAQLEAVAQERDRLEASVKMDVTTVDTGCQTGSLRKRQSFTGWLRHKLRSRSRSHTSRKSRRDQSA